MGRIRLSSKEREMLDALRDDLDGDLARSIEKLMKKVRGGRHEGSKTVERVEPT